VHVFFEVGGGPPEDVPGGRALAAFLSFAAMSGFGAQHPLLALAERLHDVHGVPLGPLTTFYDATAEDSEDEEKLELAWQPAGALGQAVSAAAGALRGDREAARLAGAAGADALADSLWWLADRLKPLAPEARVRLTYVL
jgi:phytoene/squalene synthetase